MITLEVVGPYPPEGWQDEEGVIFYNKTVMSPFGEVKNLKIEDGIIKETPEVALISLPAVEKQESATISVSPLGAKTVRFRADNGEVEYLIQNDDVFWSDQSVQIPHSLATLVFKDWAEVE